MKKLLLVIFIFVLSLPVFAQSATVISEKANLRGTPTEQGKVVNTISRNTSLEVIKQSGVWFLVQTTDYVGWIHGNTIKLNGSLTNETIGNSTLLKPLSAKPAPSPPIQSKSDTRSTAPKTDNGYYLGPRGGCYTYTSGGKKRYVDRSLCH